MVVWYHDSWNPRKVRSNVFFVFKPPALLSVRALDFPRSFSQIQNVILHGHDPNSLLSTESSLQYAVNCLLEVKPSEYWRELVLSPSSFDTKKRVSQYLVSRTYVHIWGLWFFSVLDCTFSYVGSGKLISLLKIWGVKISFLGYVWDLGLKKASAGKRNTVANNSRQQDSMRNDVMLQLFFAWVDAFLTSLQIKVLCDWVKRPTGCVG